MRGAAWPRLALEESLKAIAPCFAAAIAKLWCSFPKAYPSRLSLVDQGCVMHYYPWRITIIIRLRGLMEAAASPVRDLIAWVAIWGLRR